MPRARAGAARHRRKVKLFKQAKGYRGARGNRLRAAQEAVWRAGSFAYRDRRTRKRDFRRLWVMRVSAASKARGVPYSRFVFGLQEARVMLNRKMLSEIAISDPTAFDAVADLAKQHIPSEVA